MNQEWEVFVELGNRLLHLYCRDCVRDITGISKWTFRDQLMTGMAQTLRINYDLLPSEETFYRAFRKKQYSSAMKEKLSILYYAGQSNPLDVEAKRRYEYMANTQRVQSFPYWNRFMSDHERQSAVAANQPSGEISMPEKEKKKLLDKNLVSSLSEDEVKQLLKMLRRHGAKLDMDIKMQQKLRGLENQKDYKSADAFVAQIAHKKERELAAKYFQRAGYQRLQLHFDQAMKFYQRAVELHPENVEYLFELGKIRREKTLTEDARTNLERAEAICLKQTAKNYKQLADIYNELGIVWFDAGNYDKAHVYLKKGQKAYALTGITNFKNEVSILGNLGVIYDAWGQYKKAHRYFQQAAQIATEHLGDRNHKVGGSYYNMGHILARQQKYSAAVIWYEKALKFDTEVLGEIHPNVASDYNGIGTLWVHQKKFRNALFCFNKSLKMFSKLFGEYHNDTALVIGNIGMARMGLEDYQGAMQYFERQKIAYSKMYPPDHPKQATLHNNMGTAYGKLKNYKKAVLHLQQSLAILKKHFDKDHPRIKGTTENLTLYQKHLKSNLR